MSSNTQITHKANNRMPEAGIPMMQQLSLRILRKVTDQIEL